jgi:hypothetical protein
MTCGCGKKPAKKAAKKAPAKKALSSKQQKIAKVAGDPNKIGADDLAAIRGKKGKK